MRMRSLILGVAVLMLAAFSNAPAEEKTDRAVAAAEAWVGLVDAEDYAKSWQEAAPVFRKSLSEKGWVQMVAAVRGPLGAVKSRERIGAQYAASLPNAPAGEYVVIQFRTDFANRAGVIETITPMKDAEGAWRVSGYFLK